MVCSLTAGQKTIVIQNKKKRNDPNRNRNATVDFTGDHPRVTHASIDRQQMTVAVWQEVTRARALARWRGTARARVGPRLQDHGVRRSRLNGDQPPRPHRLYASWPPFTSATLNSFTLAEDESGQRVFCGEGR